MTKRSGARQAVLLLAALLAGGCGGAQTDGPAGPGGGSSLGVPGGQVAGETVESREPTPPTCADLLVRYREVLASGAGTCRTEADCGVYGGLDPERVCGGQTDRDTAAALQRIEDESNGAGCPAPGSSCPAILVRCLDGFCR